MNRMNWRVHEAITPEEQSSFSQYHEIIAQLLENRGIRTVEAADHFLHPDFARDLHDPFLFTDMRKAVDRIFRAITDHEKVMVYGDYDADGVCSSAVMTETLRAIGADVDIYIPFRETEGYGLNSAAATKFIEKNVALIITVDCGISNVSEVDQLQNAGIDVIITDHHHEPLVVPNAYAIINPNVQGAGYPFHGLAGCGVAFKVASALLSCREYPTVRALGSGWEKWLLDLVAIGTIADMQPLLDENRILTVFGLVVLQKTRRAGLKELLKTAAGPNGSATIDERTVGWQISPRLNAAGRLNHASVAYELLTTTDTDMAKKLADELNKTNSERQSITERISIQAHHYIGDVGTKPILIAVGTDWPTGVVGLVAGRLTDEFRRPSLVISHYKGQIIGSGRSIPEFNIIESIQKADACLVRYGGHGQACGFTVKPDRLDEFITTVTQLATEALGTKTFKRELLIDAAVPLQAIDWKLFSQLERFRPYGEGNPKPCFLAHAVTIVDVQSIGRDSKHLRLMVNHHTPIIRKTIGFSFGDLGDKLKAGDTIDMVFEVDVNEWNGRRELQLKIIDLQSSHES